MTEDDYIKLFLPFRDAKGSPIEDASDYAKRIQKTILHHWPTEVLIEWFYRHSELLRIYSFLKFERFRFHRHVWELNNIPGAEVFANPRFFDNFINIDDRARRPGDWLARYMVRMGTWNTPPIFLDTVGLPYSPIKYSALRRPVHLLEGHRRISFLNGLRNNGKANSEHQVWVVRIVSANGKSRILQTTNT